MIAESITYEDYLKKTGHTFAFCRAEFMKLNQSKVDSVEYLLFKKEGSERFAVCFGMLDGHACCPFSAPFGCPISLKKDLGMAAYDEMLGELERYAVTNGWNSIRWILPPAFYHEDEVTGWVNALYRRDYKFANIDINYAFDLREVNCSSYEKLIHHNARKNLRIALNSDLKLCICETDSDREAAYQIIAENRADKGYPLRMTYQQVCDTVQIIPHEFFLVEKEHEKVAAALVYRINEDIAQVIYWGDRLQYREYKTINFLSYQLIHYYGERGLKYLDIGPSTENSIPNYGLCDFKESIGCKRSLKYTMVKELRQSDN